MENLARKAENFIKELRAIGTSINTKENKEDLQSKVKSGLDDQIKSGKMDKFKLQEVLLEQVKEKKMKNMNPFERLRDEIVNFFHSTFTCYLDNMPLDWNWSS